MLQWVIELFLRAWENKIRWFFYKNKNKNLLIKWIKENLDDAVGKKKIGYNFKREKLSKKIYMEKNNRKVYINNSVFVSI